jgi:membrane protein required for colicin V production
LSTLLAFVRGVVREMIALLAWVAGFVMAIQYAAPVAGWLAGLEVAPAARHVLGFVLILLTALIAGALVARTLSGVVRAIGLGFLDRLLGAVFGVARGLLAIVAFALVAGVTALPRHDWWQNSILGQPLGQAALSLRPYLPRAWAERLDFSAAGTVSARLGAVAAGDRQSCVES